MENTKPKPCMLCGVATTGSVGAAGIRWSMLCQPCKDDEDAAALRQAKAAAEVLKPIFGTMFAFGKRGE